MSSDPRAAPTTPELPGSTQLDLAAALDEDTRDVHAAPGLRVTSARIDEVDSDGDPTVSIARERVERVTLDHGLASERPLVELVVGAALVAPLAWLVPRAGAIEGAGPLRVAFAVAFLGLGGAWLVARSLRRRHVLRVSLVGGGSRKLALLATCRVEDRDALARALRDRGWPLA